MHVKQRLVPVKTWARAGMPDLSIQQMCRDSKRRRNRSKLSRAGKRGAVPLFSAAMGRKCVDNAHVGWEAVYGTILEKDDLGCE